MTPTREERITIISNAVDVALADRKKEMEAGGFSISVDYDFDNNQISITHDKDGEKTKPVLLNVDPNDLSCEKAVP